jgi:uncharacterized protein YbjQ (UPF0145 family)
LVTNPVTPPSSPRHPVSSIAHELIRKAEDIDANAIIGLDYETDSIVPIEGTGLRLKRILAIGVAVKLACAA